MLLTHLTSFISVKSQAVLNEAQPAAAEALLQPAAGDPMAELAQAATGGNATTLPAQEAPPPAEAAALGQLMQPVAGDPRAVPNGVAPADPLLPPAPAAGDAGIPGLGDTAAALAAEGSAAAAAVAGDVAPEGAPKRKRRSKWDTGADAAPVAAASPATPGALPPPPAAIMPPGVTCNVLSVHTAVPLNCASH